MQDNQRFVYNKNVEKGRHIIMEKTFYSNCLLEAVKAKLKDWKDIKIFYIPKKFNDTKCFHFMWKNTKTNETFDFKAEKALSSPLKLLYFKGHIRKVSIQNYYSKYMNNEVSKYLKSKYRKEELKIEKKYGYTSENSSLEFYNYWHEKWHYISDNETPSLNDGFGDLVQVLIESDSSLQLCLMEIDENGIKNESNLKIKCWRYFNAPANTDDYFFSVC